MIRGYFGFLPLPTFPHSFPKSSPSHFQRHKKGVQLKITDIDENDHTGQSSSQEGIVFD